VSHQVLPLLALLFIEGGLVIGGGWSSAVVGHRLHIGPGDDRGRRVGDR